MVSLITLSGLKAGGIAAFGCGVLGFTGGTVLKRKEEMAEEAGETDETAERALNVENNERPADPNKED